MIEPNSVACGATFAFFHIAGRRIRLSIRVARWRGEWNTHPDLYAVDEDEGSEFPWFQAGTYYFRPEDIVPDRFWEHPRLQSALKSWEVA